ncbi:hypothetical protein ACS386_05480 [Flavobacteriaceae bacterium LMO-SS05]
MNRLLSDEIVPDFTALNIYEKSYSLANALLTGDDNLIFYENNGAHFVLSI